MDTIAMANLNGLDLNLLRVLDALLRERSATRAGERLGLSQPAVSAALGRLRRALDDPLFVRSGNAMLPTPRAEALAGPLRQAMALLAGAVEDAAGFDPAVLERTCTLLGADFFSMLFMPRFAARLAGIAPGLRLRLLDSASGDVAALLREDVIDAALERPLDLPAWVSSSILFRSPFLVIAAAGNARISALHLEAGAVLPVEPFCTLAHAIRSIDGSMSGFTDAALREGGLSRRVVLALPHFQAVALAVAGSEMIACVPAQFARHVAAELGLAVYRPPVAIPVPEIRLYWHARQDRSPAHRWLRAEIAATIAELGFDRDEELPV